jgi:phage-related protein
MVGETRKPLKWVGSAKRDLDAMPDDVKDVFGYALDLAQAGGKHPDAKPLAGFKSAGVLEIVEDHRGDTYRAVYTVRFAGWLYVLHCFQKKSKSGTKTPREDIELVHTRLAAARRDYAAWERVQGDG